MLAIDLSVIDVHGKKLIQGIKVIRGAKHPKLRSHFYYSYSAAIADKIFTGKVLHNYDHGAITLTHKVTKAIVAQQKAEKAKQ